MPSAIQRYVGGRPTNCGDSRCEQCADGREDVGLPRNYGEAVAAWEGGSYGRLAGDTAPLTAREWEQLRNAEIILQGGVAAHLLPAANPTLAASVAEEVGANPVPRAFAFVPTGSVSGRLSGGMPVEEVSELDGEVVTEVSEEQAERREEGDDSEEEEGDFEEEIDSEDEESEDEEERESEEEEGTGETWESGAEEAPEYFTLAEADTLRGTASGWLWVRVGEWGAGTRGAVGSDGRFYVSPLGEIELSVYSQYAYRPNTRELATVGQMVVAEGAAESGQTGGVFRVGEAGAMALGTRGNPCSPHDVYGSNRAAWEARAASERAASSPGAEVFQPEAPAAGEGVAETASERRARLLREIAEYRIVIAWFRPIKRVIRADGAGGNMRHVYIFSDGWACFDRELSGSLRAWIEANDRYVLKLDTQDESGAPVKFDRERTEEATVTLHGKLKESAKWFTWRLANRGQIVRVEARLSSNRYRIGDTWHDERAIPAEHRSWVFPQNTRTPWNNPLRRDYENEYFARGINRFELGNGMTRLDVLPIDGSYTDAVEARKRIRILRVSGGVEGRQYRVVFAGEDGTGSEYRDGVPIGRGSYLLDAEMAGSNCRYWIVGSTLASLPAYWEAERERVTIEANAAESTRARAMERLTPHTYNARLATRFYRDSLVTYLPLSRVWAATGGAPEDAETESYVWVSGCQIPQAEREQFGRILSEGDRRAYLANPCQWAFAVAVAVESEGFWSDANGEQWSERGHFERVSVLNAEGEVSEEYAEHSYCEQWLTDMDANSDDVSRAGLWHWEDNTWRDEAEPLHGAAFETETRGRSYTVTGGLYRPAEYHSLIPQWRTPNFGTRSPARQVLWGVELELKCKGETELGGLVKLVAETWGMGVAVAERDGSLDRATGVEIVFAPVGFDVLTGDTFKGYLAGIEPFLANRLQPDSYGFHLNIGNGNFGSELHRLKFSQLLNNADAITEAIAKRSSNRFAEVSKRSSLPEKKKLGKYAFVSHKENRVEVRIFRASAYWGRFKLQCEYCKAAIDFTRAHGPEELQAADFEKWLKESAVGAGDYRLLRGFLGIDDKAAEAIAKVYGGFGLAAKLKERTPAQTGTGRRKELIGATAE